MFGEYGKQSVNVPNHFRTLVYGWTFGDFGLPNVSVRPKLKNPVSVQHYVSGEPGHIKHFLSQTIQQHKKTFTEDNIRDFIDAYLVQIKVQTYSYCFNFDVLLYTNIIF